MNTGFLIVYTTNLSGDRQFTLNNKNIQNRLGKRSKNKKLINKGDRVIYLDPNDKKKFGMTARVRRLNYDVKKLRRGPQNLTQYPRSPAPMGTYNYIPPTPPTSYDIKIVRPKGWQGSTRSGKLNPVIPPKNHRKIDKVKPEYLFHENSATALWYTRKIVTSNKDADNVIRKIVNKLLAKGMVFVPTGILDKQTGKIHPPSPEQQFKIRDVIINVQDGKRLFTRSGIGNSNLIISLNIFLQETKTPDGQSIPFSMNKVKNNINMSCDYHWAAIKNIGKRIVGGKRQTKKTRKHSKRHTRKK